MRTLLLWLLVLALPVQGAMAATMVFCGPGQYGLASAATVSHDAHAQHEHSDDSAQAPGHHAAGDASKTESLGAEASDGFIHADAQKCSVCASCCSAAAILGTGLSVPVLQPAPTLFVTVVPTVETLAADGPDRPPRHPLA